MTGYEFVLTEVESRLTTPTDFIPGDYGTRRGHLTPPPLPETGPAAGAHIVGGDDDPQANNQCGGRDGGFIVSIFTRSDAGSAAADPYIIELYARMKPAFAPGVVVTPGKIRRRAELADNDAAQTDCEFAVTYTTVADDEWSLEYKAP